MTDAEAFREGVGRLLAEVQRIKATGDYDAARALFETYGVHFDPQLRDEVVARVDALDLPSYTGFVMPRLEPVTRRDGRDRRRRHLVPAGLRDADARVLGERPRRRAMTFPAAPRRMADVMPRTLRSRAARRRFLAV